MYGKRRDAESAEGKRMIKIRSQVSDEKKSRREINENGKG